MGIVVKFRKRGGEITGDAFLTGRNLPGHIAGTTIVATTFDANTLLTVAWLVFING